MDLLGIGFIQTVQFTLDNLNSPENLNYSQGRCVQVRQGISRLSGNGNAPP